MKSKEHKGIASPVRAGIEQLESMFTTVAELFAQHVNHARVVMVSVQLADKFCEGIMLLE